MKKKIYFFGPIVALALFAGYTAHFTSEYNAKEEQKANEARIIKEAKLKAETEARKKALEDALASQQKLKKERLEKEADLAAKKEARQAAIDARDKAYREQEKLARNIERLKKDLRVEQEVVAKLEGSIKYNLAEKQFFADYAKKSLDNAKSLGELLAKIDAAEAARASAAAAAAKQSKNNS